ncbi:MAG: hypothetical protein CVU71_07645 [Deltaproteobacteria bacterium HGW-Deltaproteobacteria-6]|nr:MAG: hypothetical protein CVU71_07645 [Deltaproteobacteria bacterium HGW-Deltaproteobacteria-6]
MLKNCAASVKHKDGPYLDRVFDCPQNHDAENSSPEKSAASPIFSDSIFTGCFTNTLSITAGLLPNFFHSFKDNGN